MDVLLFALNLSWKILVLCMGWMLFKYVLKNGSGTFKEFLETISLALRTFGHWIRKVCLNYLRKESAPAGNTNDISEDHKNEFDELMDVYSRAKADNFRNPPEYYRNAR